jgi:hypothetical protein
MDSGASGVTRQVCRNCNEDKPVTLGAWAFKPSGEPLQICLVCQTLRKTENKERAEKKEKGGAIVPKTPKDIRGEGKLDAAKAMRAGAQLANEYVDLVLARVLQYVADPKHPLHGWALQFMAERIMPRRLYEDLGQQAAGVVGKERTQHIIQILPAQSIPAQQQPTAAAPAPAAIEGQATVISVEPVQPDPKPTGE